jgi:hypothetical protein
MSRTVWLALFCLIGLAPAIALKVAAPSASLKVERALPPGGIEPPVTANDAEKSDRLALPNARAETGIVVPESKLMAVETPSSSPEPVSPGPEPPSPEPVSTSPEPVSISPEPVSPSPKPARKVADRHWRNANASLISAAPRPRHVKSKELKQSASKDPPPKERTAVWHCRQDAMGSLLRSLDLSPRCDL